MPEQFSLAPQAATTMNNVTINQSAVHETPESHVRKRSVAVSVVATMQNGKKMMGCGMS